MAASSSFWITRLPIARLSAAAIDYIVRWRTKQHRARLPLNDSVGG
jgi:hypothetical protein